MSTQFEELKAMALACPQEPWAYEPHGDTDTYGVGVMWDGNDQLVTGYQESGEMLVVESIAPEVNGSNYAAFIAAACPVVVLELIAALEKLQQANAAQADHINQQQDRIDALEKQAEEFSKSARKYVEHHHQQTTADGNKILELVRRNKELEASETKLIAERDNTEAALNAMYRAVMGEYPEWSNLYWYAHAVEDVAQRTADLEQRLQQKPAGYIDARCFEGKYPTGGSWSLQPHDIGGLNQVTPFYLSLPPLQKAIAARVDGVKDIRQQHAEWSDKTFGLPADVGPVGPLEHLAKEAIEAAENPEDLHEWADIQFLFWDALRRAGISDQQLNQAMIEKLAVNKAREWPEPKDGEPRLHIKAKGERGISDES